MPGCVSAPTAAPAGLVSLAGAAVADPGNRDASGGWDSSPARDAIPRAWDAIPPARDVIPTAWDTIPPGWDTIPPTDEELWRLASGYACGPPDGDDGWAIGADDVWAMGVDADLAVLPRDGGPGAGFAVGGAADTMPPSVTLVELASGAWAAGLERLT